MLLSQEIRSRPCISTTLVFDGTCREDKECFLYAAPDRTAETLLETVSGSVKLTVPSVSSTDVLYTGGKSLRIINNFPTVDSV